jgi:extracellular factor (EF) 3-hydroxypalmitic acid methyl ester biosynthesis protein
MQTAEVATQDSLVVFKSSQGLDLQASMLKLNRHQAAFEVCGPNVLRTSEVLQDFKIVMQDRTVYCGRAVVSNIVNTGTVLVCEAALEDAWVDLDFSSLASEKRELRAGFDAFIRQWQKIYKISPEYKVIIADLQTFFTDLRLWLEQVELGIRSLPSSDRLKAEQEAVEELRDATTPALDFYFEKFEVTARSIDRELGPAHGAFCRRLLHPFLMSSPFMHRIFVKPLGYAGDYEMVNMILRDPREGGSLFAKLLNVYILSQVPATAHRNRVTYLTQKLVEETVRVTHQLKRPARILNLGCGPAKEIQNFLSQHPISENAQFELLDFDEEPLMHVRQAMDQIKAEHHRRTLVKVVKKSVQQVLKQVGKPRSDGQDYDFIYCAGLFDYLNNRICKSLLAYFYELATPGGLVVATNVEGSNPIRNIMEYMFEWHLVYRNSPEFAALAPGRARPDAIRMETETSAGNIFLEIRKPLSAS